MTVSYQYQYQYQFISKSREKKLKERNCTFHKQSDAIKIIAKSTVRHGLSAKALLVSFALILFGTQLASAQDDPKIQELEAKVNAAKLEVEKADEMVLAAELLIKAGEDLIKEGTAELKVIASDDKDVQKSFAREMQPINKALKSRDKEEVAQAKADKKLLETKYKADMKSIESRSKLAKNKISNGDNTITKGKKDLIAAKDYKKGADAAYMDAKKALENALTGK